MTTTLNFATAPGHQVLAAAGKKILRPGGKAATEQLFTWANFQPGETVLELGASFGESAIQMAQRFNVRVVGIEKNPDSVIKARENIQAAGLSDQITIIEGDIFELDKITDKFDYVLAEAILTMQADAGKAKILSGIKNCLKPGGKFLGHEMLVRDNAEQVRKSLSKSIRVNANPLTVSEWSTTCKNAGLTIQQQQTGKMGLLNLNRMIGDEGILRTVKIIWNLLTKPCLRSRVLQMRRNFQQQRDHIGYIIFMSSVT